MQDVEKRMLSEISSQVGDVTIPAEFLEQAEQIQGLLLYYSYAIKEVRTKLEILNEELAFKTKRNPIESIESRVKKPASIIEKLRRRNFPVSVESVFENLHDVAGVRVICSFIDDIYDVAEMFLSQDDITLIEKKDYIQNPKSNGYRSLHLIIEVPVFLSDRTLNMKVEVQIRTMAMDFWAALEHQANYKKGIDGIDSLVVELTDCANIINQTDRRMQEIYHKIQKGKREQNSCKWKIRRTAFWPCADGILSIEMGTDEIIDG